MVLCDLDGTIVHSARRVDVADRAGATVVERYEGRDVGFMSAEAWDLLKHLQRRCSFVPVTARTIRQFRRIVLPEKPTVAVVACGAIVLIDDAPDPLWEAEVDRLIRDSGTDAKAVAAEMAALDVTEPPRIGDERFAFVRVRPGSDVRAFEAWSTERGWRIVRQDGRIYALPAALSKQSAVGRVAEICDAEPFLALGDGMMDAELLASTPHALTPIEGHLWRSGWRSGTPVLGDGLAGTEALLRKALDLLEPLVSATAAHSDRPTSC